MSKLAAFLLAFGIPVPVAAQSVADSFADLNRMKVLKEGETIWVTWALERGGDYVETEATFRALTDAAITVRVDPPPSGRTDVQVEPGEDGEVFVIPEDRVTRIAREHEDTIWKGAMIGATIGGGSIAVPIGIYCARAGPCGGEDAGWIAVAVAIPAGIGFGIGAAVDASRDDSRTEVVYVASRRGSRPYTLSVIPIVSRARKEVHLSLTW